MLGASTFYFQCLTATTQSHRMASAHSRFHLLRVPGSRGGKDPLFPPSRIRLYASLWARYDLYVGCPNV